jgi:hypothetical protein
MNSVQKKKIGDNMVESRFINDSLMDGIANFYDLDRNLLSTRTYSNGLKNGATIFYYKNGRIKDSMNYTNDVLNGPSYEYDSLGKLKFTVTHFHGIEFGDHAIYNGGKIQKYYFTDFEKRMLIRCYYDSTGLCDSIEFNAAPILTDYSTDEGEPIIRMFVYFPHPPNFGIRYKVGTIDNNHNKQSEFLLNTHRQFLDTIISFKRNLNYFISIDYKNLLSDSIDNIFYREYKF